MWVLGQIFPEDSSCFAEKVENYWLKRPTKAIGNQARRVSCHWGKDFHVRGAIPTCFDS